MINTLRPQTQEQRQAAQAAVIWDAGDRPNAGAPPNERSAHRSNYLTFPSAVASFR